MTANAHQPLRNVGRGENKIHTSRLNGAARHSKKSAGFSSSAKVLPPAFLIA
jgi:hypothetical protein